MQSAAVAEVRPAVDRSVRIEQFGIEPLPWCANPVVIPRHRSEITHAQDLVLGVATLSQKGNDRIGRVMEVHPLEALPVMIDGIEGRLGLVYPVEITHEVLHA